MAEKPAFSKPTSKGRPSKRTKTQGEIDRLLLSWRKGGEAGRKSAQILLKKYNIRAVQLLVT